VQLPCGQTRRAKPPSKALEFFLLFSHSGKNTPKAILKNLKNRLFFQRRKKISFVKQRTCGASSFDTLWMSGYGIGMNVTQSSQARKLRQ
jgi:hypothetical protein